MGSSSKGVTVSEAVVVTVEVTKDVLSPETVIKAREVLLSWRGRIGNLDGRGVCVGDAFVGRFCDMSIEEEKLVSCE